MAHIIDPLTDSRWDAFVAEHPAGSVFHTSGWLAALKGSYGYRPIVFTATPPGKPLRDGLVFCEIRSWLTGKRLVSLPFADHCEPLAQPSELPALLDAARQYIKDSGGGHVEVRPRGNNFVDPNLAASQSFDFHVLDLTPSCETLFRTMHKDCIQRKVRRAERDGLHYEAGNNAELLRKFYALLKITRRRHRLPPQPFAWFRNLADSMGDRLGVHVASKDEHPAASILTLRYRSTLTYKYGCSDPAFNSSGGTALLFWKAIEQAKSVGLSELDLGRTDADNEGLKTFKERLGGVHSRLTYYSTRSGATAAIPQWSKIPAVRALFACAPDPLLTSLGTLFYKHSG